MKTSIWILIVLVAGAAAGYGGYWYGERHPTAVTLQSLQNLSSADRQQLLGSARSGGRGAFFRTGAGGGLTAGQILSIDSSSLTLKQQDGSTKIVLLTGSTQTDKFVSGAISDLTVGENVVVSGTANSDGSVTATTVQIRPPQQTSPVPAPQ